MRRATPSTLSTLLEQLWLDLRYAWRMMRAERTVSLLAVLTLALGIGANTAIFSLINVLMLRPLPVQAPEQLVEALSRYPGEPRVNGFSWKVYEHVRDRNTIFSDLIGLSLARFRVSADGGDAENADGHHVTGNFFPALGVRPALGRLIGPDDDRVGSSSAAVVVLSWQYWKRRFNLDPTILDKTIVVDGVPATVIGITPPEFFGVLVGLEPQVWAPVAMVPMIQSAGASAGAGTSAGVSASAAAAAIIPDRFAMGLIGRLKPGVSMAQANAEIRVLDRWRIDELAKRNPNPAIRQITIELASAKAGIAILRDHLAPPLLALMVIVGLLLLLACINVATMLLARGAARQREMAVRVSLGAGRFRLVRQVLTESLLVSAVAAVLGMILAHAGATVLARLMLSGQSLRRFRAPLTLDLQPDAQVLMFTGAAAVLTAIIFGMAPAWSAFTSAPVSLLRHAGETRSRRLLGKSLIVAQVVCAVVLLSAAGVLAGHLANLRGRDLGFQRDSVLLVSLQPEGAGYNRQQLTNLYRDVLAQLETIPGVRVATLSGITPMSGAGMSRFIIAEGFQESSDARRYVAVNPIAPKYFATYGTPLLAGREFRMDDEGRSRVAIVNQALAQYYFPNSSPLGKHVSLDGEPGPPYEIVGVVGNAKYSEVHDAPPRTLYLHAFQDGRIGSQLALRTAIAPATIAGDVRRIVTERLKTVKVGKVTTLEEQVDGTLVPERLLASLSGLFAAQGAALAAIGLYGLLAFTVARRTKEIGVRMALGATRHHVIRMVLNSALAPVYVGLAVGVPLAIAARDAAGRLMRLTADGALPIGLAAAAMIGVALLAAYVPARRAARVEPREALRED